MKYKIKPTTGNFYYVYLSKLRFFTEKEAKDYLKNSLHKHFKIVEKVRKHE